MIKADLKHCALCPRNCGADRSISEGDVNGAVLNGMRKTGYCGAGSGVKIARADLHFWEEPCISGDMGSGTVFFSGCPLKCRFCQNYIISEGNFGKEVTTERLSEIFLELQEKEAHNINLVNPTHYVPWIIEALDLIRDKLQIPTVYNSGGYDSTATLEMLEGYISVYLPDLKYVSPYMSKRYSSAADYFDRASEALKEMYRQAGPVAFDEDGVIKKGLIVRHLVLPGGSSDSKSAFNWLSKAIPAENILVSIMSQYTPCHRSSEYPEIDRKVDPDEYGDVVEYVRDLGFKGYFQESDSAREEYTPPFDLTGV
jgi:putative pyruvate formate lyase activating enzyme